MSSAYRPSPVPAAGLHCFDEYSYICGPFASLMYLDVTGGLGEGAEGPGSPRAWNPEWIYGKAAPGGLRFHMRGQGCPWQPWSPNDGIAIRIQGIRTLWLRQRVLLKSTKGYLEW